MGGKVRQESMDRTQESQQEMAVRLLCRRNGMCHTVFPQLANANDSFYLQIPMAIDSLPQVPCEMHQEIKTKRGRCQGVGITSWRFPT